MCNIVDEVERLPKREEAKKTSIVEWHTLR